MKMIKGNSDKEQLESLKFEIVSLKNNACFP